MAIQYYVGAKAIIFNTKLKKLLVLKRSVYDIAAGFWENAGGKKEVGETLEDSLKREVQEETGIEVNDFYFLYTSVNNEKNNPYFIIGYFVPTEKEDIELSFEHVEYRWVSIEEYLELVDMTIRHDFRNSNVLEYIKKYN